MAIVVSGEATLSFRVVVPPCKLTRRARRRARGRNRNAPLHSYPLKGLDVLTEYAPALRPSHAILVGSTPNLDRGAMVRVIDEAADYPGGLVRLLPGEKLVYPSETVGAEPTPTRYRGRRR